MNRPYDVWGRAGVGEALEGRLAPEGLSRRDATKVALLGDRRRLEKPTCLRTGDELEVERGSLLGELPALDS